jgi:hypothetical protein
MTWLKQKEALNEDRVIRWGLPAEGPALVVTKRKTAQAPEKQVGGYL